MILTETQKEKLKELVPDKYESLIIAEDVNDILGVLDELYLDLLDDDQEPTDQSREVEHLRDEIHWDNTH